jgi:hypothetical protein
MLIFNNYNSRASSCSIIAFISRNAVKKIAEYDFMADKQKNSFFIFEKDILEIRKKYDKNSKFSQAYTHEKIKELFSWLGWLASLWSKLTHHLLEPAWESL